MSAQGNPKSVSQSGPIHVAVDFTADSEEALVWACDYAAAVGADVTVCMIVHDPAEAPGSYRKGDNRTLKPMQDVAAQMMSTSGESRKGAPRAHGPQDRRNASSQGIPATRVLETAEQIDARMIVMGSRGRTGLPHLLLGSKGRTRRAAVADTRHDRQAAQDEG